MYGTMVYVKRILRYLCYRDLETLKRDCWRGGWGQGVEIGSLLSW